MTILADVTTEIIEWSKELMPWQRMILRRLLADDVLSEADRSEIFKRAKIDYGLDPNGSLKDEILLDAKLTKGSKRSGSPLAYLPSLMWRESTRFVRASS